MDVSGLLRLPGEHTPVYSALMGHDGELLYGVIDSRIFAHFTFHHVLQVVEMRGRAWVVLDANGEVEFISRLCQHFTQHHTQGTN